MTSLRKIWMETNLHLEETYHKEIREQAFESFRGITLQPIFTDFHIVARMERNLNVSSCLLSVSVTKFIRIGIADKNDNPPYFDKGLYEAEVDENEDIQHTVLTVTAKDHDECKWTYMQIRDHFSLWSAFWSS